MDQCAGEGTQARVDNLGSADEEGSALGFGLAKASACWMCVKAGPTHLVGSSSDLASATQPQVLHFHSSMPMMEGPICACDISWRHH